jgi:hypothetical protein
MTNTATLPYYEGTLSIQAEDERFHNLGITSVESADICLAAIA